jgi:hypothetical protein
MASSHSLCTPQWIGTPFPNVTWRASAPPLCLERYIVCKIMAPKLTSWHAYHGIWAHHNGVLHKSLPSDCLYVYSPITARQRLGINFTTATNTDTTIEELLDVSFCVRSVSYLRKVCGSVYPSIVARQRLLKQVSAATWNCWRRCFLCGSYIKGK